MNKLTNKKSSKDYKIIVIGASWHGSDCTGLARGFRELGCSVELIGSDQFFPKTDKSILSRIIHIILRFYFKKQFNNFILKTAHLIKPDLIVVFKGNHVSSESTLKQLSKLDTWLVNFYPDISVMNHSSVEVQGFKFYNHIFTTKTFGINDLKFNLGLTNVSFLPHGYDQLVHRPIFTDIDLGWKNDVSFIGGWCQKKENILKDLAKKLPKIKLKIWGPGWENNSSKCLEDSIVGYPIYGDYYAMAINSSSINLGLLQEIEEGASSGDLITARTFHIPASGGFMLHEHTEEISQYFEEDKEAVFFSSSDDLVEKIKYYLKNEKLRKKIAKAGYARCIRENKLTYRALSIINKYEKIKNKS